MAYDDESIVRDGLSPRGLSLNDSSAPFPLNGWRALSGEGLPLASGDGQAVGVRALASAALPGPMLLYCPGEGAPSSAVPLLPAVGAGAISSVDAYAPVDAPTSASPTIAVNAISLRMP